MGEKGQARTFKMSSDPEVYSLIVKWNVNCSNVNSIVKRHREHIRVLQHKSSILCAHLQICSSFTFIIMNLVIPFHRSTIYCKKINNSFLFFFFFCFVFTNCRSLQLYFFTNRDCYQLYSLGFLWWMVQG